jgi:hypothetical protein
MEFKPSIVASLPDWALAFTGSGTGFVYGLIGPATEKLRAAQRLVPRPHQHYGGGTVSTAPLTTEDLAPLTNEDIDDKSSPRVVNRHLAGAQGIAL